MVGAARQNSTLVPGVDMGECEYLIARTPGYILFDQRMQHKRETMDILPLWIHCIELEAGEFVLSSVMLKRLYSSWTNWVGGRWSTLLSNQQVSKQDLGSWRSA